jgi:hypothetical protein
MKEILYFGGNRRVVDLIKKKVGALSVKITTKTLSDLSFYSDEEEGEKKILLVDLSPWDETLFAEIVPVLNLLEKDGVLRRCCVYLLFGHDPELVSKATLANCHAIKSYLVVGEDEDLFGNKLLCELELEEDKSGRYLSVSQLEVRINCLIPFKVNKIGIPHCLMSGPFQIKKGDFQIKGSLLSDLNQKMISLEKSDQGYHFSLPFKRPGFISKKDDINQDIFIREINANKNFFRQRRGSIFLIGNDEKSERISRLLDYQANARVHFINDLDILKEEVNKHHPSVLFINLKDEANLKGEESDLTGFVFEDLLKVKSAIPFDEFYKPIIIVLNSPSRSLALRQVFRYDKIVALEEELSREILYELISKYNEKKLQDLSLEQGVIPIDSNVRSCGWIISEVCLHQMSEDRFTFSCPYGLEEGSWIHLEFPFALTAEITDIQPSPLGRDQKKYSCRILGLCGEAERYLRVFLNFAYKDPKEVFTYYNEHPTLLIDNLKKHLHGNGFEVDYGKEEDTHH